MNIPQFPLMAQLAEIIVPLMLQLNEIGGKRNRSVNQAENGSNCSSKLKRSVVK